MSRNFFSSNNDDDSNEEAQSARRQSFLRRMEQKLEFKKSAANPNYDDDRFLIR